MDIGWSLKHTVLWERNRHEPDAYGQNQYYPGTNLQARLVRKPTLVRKPDGVEVISDTQFHVKHPISVGDRITHDGTDRVVISVKDGLGLHDPIPAFYVAYM